MNFKGKGLYLILTSFWVINLLAESADCESSCNKKCDTDCSISKNFWYPRSFSSYQYHDLFQMKHTHPSEKRDGKLDVSFVTEYMQNFDGKCNSCKNLGSMPFWSGTNQLTIGNNDGRAQLDAYQLGLGNIQTDENGIGGIIQLNPRIQSIGTDMMVYWVQKSDERGMYFRLHAPMGGMRVTPRLTEVKSIQPENNLSFSQVGSGGGSEFDYQFLEYPVPARRYQTISDVFFGGLGGCSDELAGSAIYGKMFGLSYGRVAPDSLAIIRLADIAATLGYNVYADEKGFAGLGFKVSFPTGNRPLALYMLEPIYGRAGLWGVGGEVSALYQVWENEACNRRITVSLQGELEHLMHGRTPSMRSFDLKKNGPGSKYLLVQDYRATYANLSPNPAINDNGTVNPNAQVYEAQYLDIAINYTTLPVLANFAVEGAVAVMVDFAWDNWNFALGGEFWGRSREKLSIDMASAVHNQSLDLNNFAVLGRQLSSYYVPGNTTIANKQSPELDVFTYLCEPLAQIGKSQDSALLSGSYPTVSTPTTLPEGVKDARLSENRIPSNLDEALDICGAEVSSVFTGKIFTHFGYNWKDCNYAPSVALVAGAEFTNTTNNAVQLWSVGLQGSLNF
ncbi:hypothetical protein HYV10_03490 [Candidatus Dependentiae bacterium]|nr:hypothetical protein [Candidatus Dependentiae bacterium]